MKTLLGKKPSDLEELTQMMKNDLPSASIQKESIIRSAVKSTSLPSEVQRSMSDILAERLRKKPVNDDVDDVVKKVSRDPMRLEINTVNMGTTLTKRDERLAKGKMLG